MRWVVMCLLAVWMACGPSTAEIHAAKVARYRGSPAELYSIAKQVAAENYKIGESHPGIYTFVTGNQWYSPEGGRQSPGAENISIVVDRSVNLRLKVEVVELLDRGQNEWAVVITPITLQYLEGSPKPRELAPDDPNLPPWIHGRVESLFIAIHKAAKRMEIH